ncbi:unnamed protein product, partial [Owenia fusiformis]
NDGLQTIHVGTSYSLKSVPANNNNTIQVKACNNAQVEGPPIATTSVTPEGRPSDPKEVKVSSIESTNVSVVWKPPTQHPSFSTISKYEAVLTHTQNRSKECNVTSPTITFTNL